MNLFWIFVYGLSLQTVATNITTEIDTSIPNINVESSTTSINNASDLFSSNDVDTEIHSSPTNSDCKNADCMKTFSISTGSDNSSASKILWNLVNTPKATIQPPVSDKIRTDEERNDLTRVSVHVPTANYSSVHNYSSANELDSEISPDYNLFEVPAKEADTVLKDSVYEHNGSFAPSTESSVMTTKIFMYKPNDFKENSTVDFESTEMDIIQDINDRDQNASDVLNVTEITPDAQETTIYTDAEMDFVTYFDAESSVDESGIKRFHNETFSHIDFFGNLATQMPYNETVTSVLDINENASTLTSTESEVVKSGNTEATLLNPESHDSLHTENISFESEDLEKSTPIYEDFITSLESQEVVSKNSRKFHDIINNTHSPPIITYFSNSVLTSKEMLNTTPVNLTDIPLKPTVPFSEVKDIFYKSAFTPENANFTGITVGKISSEDLRENDSTESSSENIDYVVEFTEPITESSSENNDNIDELTEAVTESINHTYLPFAAVEFNDSTEKADSSTTIAYPESFEIADSSDVGITSKENDLFRSYQNFPNDSLNTERSMEQTYRNDSPVSEVNKEDVSTSASSIETELEYDITTEFPVEFSVPPNTDPNVNAVDVSIVQEKSSVAPHSLDSLNEVENNVSSTETVGLDSKFVLISSTKKTPSTASSAVDDIFVEKASTTLSIDQTPYISTLKNLEIANETSNTIIPTLDTKTDTNIETSTDVLENWSGVFSSSIDLTPPETKTATAVNLSELNTDVESTTLVTSRLDETSPVNIYETISTTEKTLVTGDIVTHFSGDAKQPDTENNFHEVTTHFERKNIETSRVDVVTKMVLQSTMFSRTRDFDTVPTSRMPEIEVTSPSSAASSASSVTETHREGKHIPFSTTVVRRTTAKPVINTTTKSSLYPHYETTEKSPMNKRYNQIQAEALSEKEKANLIKAVVTFPVKFYSEEELNEIIAAIHLFLLRTVADEYKNTSQISSNYQELDQIEFEDLPEIIYIHPTPKVDIPNINFTFIVQNKFKNDTFPSDILMELFYLRSENLKKNLPDIENINFSKVQLRERDIMEEYKNLILSGTGLLAAFLLISLCVCVICYRRKTRQSEHCLTDGKLHRNLHEAMGGLDLNPPMVILQEEIREKATNGNKICNLDDDEGWLAPIGEVPIQDNNAPYIQDTKL